MSRPGTAARRPAWAFVVETIVIPLALAVGTFLAATPWLRAYDVPGTLGLFVAASVGAGGHIRGHHPALGPLAGGLLRRFRHRVDPAALRGGRIPPRRSVGGPRTRPQSGAHGNASPLRRAGAAGWAAAAHLAQRFGRHRAGDEGPAASIRNDRGWACRTGGRVCRGLCRHRFRTEAGRCGRSPAPGRARPRCPRHSPGPRRGRA